MYIILQPSELIRDTGTQAAFAAPDRLAAESEDRAEIVMDANSDEFPHTFPDMELPGDYYAKALDDLLGALYEDSDRTVNRAKQ
ncbi:MAG: hypothetical protein ABJC09_13540 [Terriglobia bacterium]